MKNPAYRIPLFDMRVWIIACDGKQKPCYGGFSKIEERMRASVLAENPHAYCDHARMICIPQKRAAGLLA